MERVTLKDLLHFLFFPVLIFGSIFLFFLYGYFFLDKQNPKDPSLQSENFSYYYSLPFGIIFQYSDKYTVVPDKEKKSISIILDNYGKEKEDANGVVISVSGDGMSAQDWLKSKYSGYDASKGYFAFDVDGQNAFETNDEDWFVFDSPKNNSRFSIVTFGPHKEENKKELQNIIDSLFFIRCPDDYTDDDKKYLELQLFADNILSNDTSTDTSKRISLFGKERENFYNEYKCKAALKRESDYKKGNVDPQEIQTINEAINDSLAATQTEEVATQTDSGKEYLAADTYEKIKNFFADLFSKFTLQNKKADENSTSTVVDSEQADRDNLYANYVGKNVANENMKDSFEKIYNSLEPKNLAKVKVIVSKDAYKNFDMMSYSDITESPEIFSKVTERECLIPADSKYFSYSYSHNSGDMCYINAIPTKDGEKVDKVLSDNYNTLYDSKDYFTNQITKLKNKSTNLKFLAFPDGDFGYTSIGSDTSGPIFQIKVGNYLLKTKASVDPDTQDVSSSTIEIYKDSKLVDTKNFSGMQFDHLYRMKLGSFDYLLLGICGGGNHGCGILLPIIYDGNNLKIGDNFVTDFSNYLDRDQFFTIGDDLFVNLDDDSNYFNYNVSNNASYNSAVPHVYKFDKETGKLILEDSMFLNIYSEAIKIFENDFNKMLSQIPTDAIPEVTNLESGDSLKPYFDYYLNMRKVLNANNDTYKTDTLKMYRQLYGPEKSIDYHPDSN